MSNTVILYVNGAKKFGSTTWNSKNTLIKFNEQIASKYRSGLSLRFLDSYAQKNVVPNSIKQFYIQNQVKQVSRIDFENILKSNTDKDINWF
jgi:hypothetical protein